jgi:hypothetical protein
VICFMIEDLIGLEVIVATISANAGADAEIVAA